MTKYYVDKEGNYIGAFIGETGLVTDDAIEVPFPPECADLKWDNVTWVAK